MAMVMVLAIAHVRHPDGWFGVVSYLTVTAGSGVVALVLAARLPREERRPWWWLAAGMACAGVADVVYEIISWRTGANPDLSVADVFYLSSYVFLAVGLFGLTHRAGRPDLDGLLDLGSFSLLSILIVYQVADLNGILTDGSAPMAVRVVWAAYPMLDAVLLAVLVKALIDGRLRRAPGIVLAAGLACWLTADFGTLLNGDATVETMWMDLGWMFGASAVAVAITLVGPQVQEADVVRRESVNLLIGLLPLAVPGVIDIGSHLHGTDTNPLPLFVATMLLLGIAFTRSLRLLRARDRNEARLVHNEHYYRALAANSAEAVLVIGPDGRLLNDEPNLMRLIGLDGPVEAGASAIDLLPPEEHERASAAFDRLRLTPGVASELTLHAQHADGSDRWFGVRAVNKTDDPDVGGLIMNVHDVTDQKRAEDELAHLAFHDTLTGLPNRALFNDRLEHAMRRNVRTGLDVAVVYLDLDGFKAVNDSLGHEVGDDVLRQTATRLESAVRPADTVARLGGDEFAILVEASEQLLERATAVAERVLQVMSVPMHVGDDEMVLSASIGIAISDPTSNGSSMLRDADIAMYQAKTSGKGKWAVYDDDMRSAVVERMEIEADLGRAIAEHQFELMYQPIVRLSSGEVTGFEALIRWNHPTRGVIPPEYFVPIAEESGAIVQIGEWVLGEACRTAAVWQDRHPERMTTIAVNVSPRELAVPNAVERVRDALALSGLNPAALVIELTESSLVRDPGLVARRLGELHELGVKIAIDDFGTGYSSLSYLRQFPVDILKIDQSFVRSITEREKAPAVLRGLLDLARTLDLETIAEGIEVDVQRDSLRAQRCEFGQGFLYARPLSARDAAVMMDRDQLV